MCLLVLIGVLPLATCFWIKWRIVWNGCVWYAGTMDKLPVKSAENQPVTHPQYRQIALAIYGGVLIVGLFDWFSGHPPSTIIPLDLNTRLIIFCVTLVALIALELVRPTVTPSTTTKWAAVYLIIIICLSSLALTLSNYIYTQLLFLSAVLFAELTFHRRISILTTITAFALLFLRMALGPQRDFISIRDAQALLIFLVMLLLIWLMARLIKSESSNRLHLQTLNDELRVSHQQLQENSEQLTKLAVVNERNRMAREIHDSLGHHLTAVSIQLEMALKLHERNPSTSIEAIKQAKIATREALHDVRQSVGALRHPNETFDLAPAVELLVGRISNDKLAVTYRLDGDESYCPQSMRLAFYRAVQEGLTNIHKHAAATRVNLWLQFTRQQARLRIIDDGIGFDLAKKTDGTGLQGLRERIEGLGGTLTIDSRPNEGTVLDLIIPQLQI